MTRVAIDVDGVVADFTTAYSTAALVLGYPGAREMSTPEVETWDWPKEQFGWTEQMEEDLWKFVKRQYNWWMTLTPHIRPHEVEMLNEAIKLHDIYFITNRPRTKGLSAEVQTRHWLDSIGVHTGSRVSVIATKSGTKGRLAAGLDITLAIDDNVGNLEDYQEYGVQAVARRWGYNQAWRGDGVGSMQQFLKAYLL